MPSIVWSGTISFVLVSIPVDIVSSVTPKISYRLLHKEDNSPIRTRMFCPHDKAVVRPEHIVNGYPVDENRYVIIREQEYRALEPRRTQTIEIDAFIDLGKINPLSIDRSYYILPRKGGAKAYRLLLDVLRETRKGGLAKFVLKSREHLVVVRAHSHILGLTMLRFPAEIKDPKEIIPSGLKSEPREVQALSESIRKLKTDYRPETFKDEHIEKVLSFLRKKAKQSTVTVQKPTEEEAIETESGDLVAALEESLAKTRAQ